MSSSTSAVGATKVVLVGEAPGRPMRPDEEPLMGRSALRIAGLAAITVAEYREQTERMNLFDQPQARWRVRDAEKAAAAILPRFDGRRVIMLGQRVAAAFDVADYVPFTWGWGVERGGRVRFDFAVIPHPSGRNRFWNTEENRALARIFLRQALQGGQG